MSDIPANNPIRNGPANYRSLDAAEIIHTARRLSARITERFPHSKLSKVAITLYEESIEAATTSQWLAKPMRAMQIFTGLVVAGLLLLVATTLGFIKGNYLLFSSLADLMQGLDAAVNEIIMFGIATFFLLNIETRLKRRRALQALHALRSLAHIIDLHQLTKDPGRIRTQHADTPSSPKRDLSVFETTRYLDYCSEMLSITGKIAALYVQDFDDPVTLAAVDEIQNLTVGLTHTIWQKITIQGQDTNAAQATG